MTARSKCLAPDATQHHERQLRHRMDRVDLESADRLHEDGSAPIRRRIDKSPSTDTISTRLPLVTMDFDCMTGMEAKEV